MRGFIRWSLSLFGYDIFVFSSCICHALIEKLPNLRTVDSAGPTHTNTHKHTPTHTHTHTHTPTHTHTNTHSHTNTHTHAHTHKDIAIFIHSCVPAVLKFAKVFCLEYKMAGSFRFGVTWVHIPAQSSIMSRTTSQPMSRGQPW
jgi:hypothetical protein